MMIWWSTCRNISISLEVESILTFVRENQVTLDHVEKSSNKTDWIKIVASNKSNEYLDISTWVIRRQL